MYLINEIFYTLQGEGYWTGRPAVFVRFARCNLWTGREEDRANAVCRFCDTDFAHGVRYTWDDLLERVCVLWPSGMRSREAMVVLTGGEPSLQVDAQLIEGLQTCGFYVAMETNGTRQIDGVPDWVCVSPKAGTELVVEGGEELKVVYPQTGVNLGELRRLNFGHFWLSPMDGPNLAENTRAAVDYCLAHPQWRLNIQTHKAVGLR
jgi:7-carboxy-7-deazaguanine synthase